MSELLNFFDICREARSISEAGRELFAHSRLEKKNANDADRLRKYLAKFDLSWSDVSQTELNNTIQGSWLRGNTILSTI